MHTGIIDSPNLLSDEPLKVIESACPLVTIIVPVYQVEMYIQECINSILAQTYKNYECLIIDDGSMDQSIQFAQTSFGDDNRFHIISKANGGLASARNCGLINAKGEFIAFLDADDYWLPDKLQNQVYHLVQNPGLDVLFCNAWICKPYQNAFLYQGPSYNGNPLELLCSNVIVGSGSSEMVRRKSLSAVGLYDERLRACEDLEFWFRCAVKGLKFWFDSTPGVRVRVRPGSLSADMLKMQNYNLLAFEIQLGLLRKSFFPKTAIWSYGFKRILHARKFFVKGSQLKNFMTALRFFAVLVKTLIK